MKKIKLIKPLLGLTILTTAFVPLASCANNNSQITLTFVSGDNGTLYGGLTVKVDKGTLFRNVIAPTPVAKADYMFDNWYNGDTVIEPETKIESSMTITAKFAYLFVKTVKAPIYLANQSTGEYIDSTVTFDIHHFNGSAMGYVKLADCYTTEQIKLAEANSKATLTNNFNTGYHGKCEFDFENQKITFDNLEQFFDFNENSFNPMTDLVKQGGTYLVQDKTTSTFQQGDKYVIDLNKYNIKLVWFGNHGYIPYELLKDVLNFPYGFNILGTQISTHSFDYNGSGLYHMPPYNTCAQPEQLKLQAAVKSTSGDYYTQDYMEYCYNLLALCLDFRFGMTQRISRVDGKTIKYLDGGIYEILKPYHDQLVSLENDTSSDAIRKVLKENFDDGGHTAYAQLNAFSTKQWTFDQVAGKEFSYSESISAELKKAREDAELTPGTGKVGHFKVYSDESGQKNDKIAYMTFDNFNPPAALTKDEEIAAKRELISCTDINNYNDDLLRLTMWANQQIKADSDIQTLVLDLGVNGGGAGFIEHFVASWLCGGVTEKVWNPKTNDYCEYKCYADVDCDGKYTVAGDTLSSDIQVYVITSSVSFSCGNILPCNIKDQRPNTKFIGHNSGGGPCIVDNNLLLGANTFMQISGCHHLLRLASTPENIISMDDGCCNPDSGWTFTTAAQFYDRDAINKKIWDI